MVKKKSASRRQRAIPIDNTKKFEELLKETDAGQRYQLCLYVTGTSLRSSQAIANIRSLCEEYLAGRYDLEVVDIYQQPAQAVEQQIIAAPTLVKKFPMPVKRLVGNLSDRDKVLVGLNLNKKSEPTAWAHV